MAAALLFTLGVLCLTLKQQQRVTCNKTRAFSAFAFFVSGVSFFYFLSASTSGPGPLWYDVTPAHRRPVGMREGGIRAHCSKSLPPHSRA